MIDSHKRTLIKAYFSDASKSIAKVSEVVENNLSNFSRGDIIETLTEIPQLIENLVIIQNLLSVHVSKNYLKPKD